MVPACQINMTFSTFSCCSVEGLKLHVHSSLPLYLSICCFEKWSFLKAGLYCTVIGITEPKLNAAGMNGEMGIESC